MDDGEVGEVLDEIAVFSPGMNTVHHHPSEGDAANLSGGGGGPVRTSPMRTSPVRLAHYANVLQMGLAQVHTGSLMDTGPSTIAVGDELDSVLRRYGVLSPEDLSELERTRRWSVDSADKDAIVAALDGGLLDTPLQGTHRK